MTTIFEVARQAGVSITTVSHVLSGNRQVAVATRERVLAVVEGLHYVPSRTSQGLAQGRTNTIAILLPNPLESCLVNPYYAQLLLILTGAISARGRSAVVLGVGGPDGRDALHAAMSGHTADGLLWIDPPARHDELSQAIRESRVPVVVGGTAPTQHRLVQVRNARRLVARLALGHLLALGHRAFGLMLGTRRLMVGPAYARAFRTELTALDGDASLQVVYVDGGSLQDGREAMELLLDQPRVPTAVVGVSESLTVGALQAAISRGVRVPGDLAVVSVGDSPLTSQFTPSVTAVDIHVQQHAVALVAALADLVTGTCASADPVLIPAHLAVRQSTSVSRLTDVPPADA